METNTKIARVDYCRAGTFLRLGCPLLCAAARAEVLPAGWRAEVAEARARAEHDGAISMGAAPLATYIEQYERKLLAEFVTRTDYYDAVAAGREVAFIPGDACQNPFAKFASG